MMICALLLAATLVIEPATIVHVLAPKQSAVAACGQHYHPLRERTIDGLRLVICARNSVGRR